MIRYLTSGWLPILPAIVLLLSTQGAGAQTMDRDQLTKMTAQYKKMADSLVKSLGTHAANKTSGGSKYDRLKYPPRNEEALASLPKKTLSDTALKKFIAGMRATALPRLHQGGHTIPISTEGATATGLSNQAILIYYQGNKLQALEMAMEGANLDPNNAVALNTLASMLNLNDFPQKAVPILEYLRENDPGNSTVNNNLGQAYVDMGDVQKGKQFLQEAIGQSPDHPNANMTLAMLACADGDKPAAIKYCESSLRGAFSVKAWTMLLHFKKDAKLMDYVKHRYKQPEIFNVDKYPLPEQCRSAGDIEGLMPVYNNYRQMLDDAIKKYDEQKKEEDEINQKKDQKIAGQFRAAVKGMNPNDIQSMRNNPAITQAVKSASQIIPVDKPFGVFGTAMMSEINQQRIDRIVHVMGHVDSTYHQGIAELKDKYEKALAAVYDKYKDKEDKFGEGNTDNTYKAEECAEINELANPTMSEMANLTFDWQKRWIMEEKDYFNDMGFWLTIGTADEHRRKAMFYGLVGQYLQKLKEIATTHFLGCIKTVDTTGKKKDSMELKEPNCPLNMEIPITTADGVKEFKKEGFAGKINLDCENFAFEMGELGKGKIGMVDVEHNFPAGETTLAFGPAVGASVPIIHMVEAAAKLQFYMTLHGAIPVDIGVRYELEMDVKGMNSPENKAGWTLGINSEGGHMELVGKGEMVNAASNKVAKYLFDRAPDAPQMNPKVPIYNKP